MVKVNNKAEALAALLRGPIRITEVGSAGTLNLLSQLTRESKAYFVGGFFISNVQVAK